MSTSLSTIIESSRKGYIDDPETIGRAVNNLLDTPVKKLAAPGWGKHVDNTVKSMTGFTGFLNAEKYDFTLADLICMALRVRDLQRDDYMLFRYAARLGHIISGAAQVSDSARLFMGTSFKAFTEYAGKKSGTNRGSRIYNKVYRFMTEFFRYDGYDEMTLKTVLEKSRGIACAWDCAMPLDQFTKRACAYFHIAEVTIIECMVLCCPEKFRFGALLNRAAPELKPEDVLFDTTLGNIVSGSRSYADIKLDWYDGPDMWCCYGDEDDDDLAPEEAAVQTDKHPAPKDNGPSWDEVTSRLRKIAEEQRKNQTA